MRYIKAILAMSLVSAPWLIGCSDNDHHSSGSRRYDPDTSVSRTYDPYGRTDRYDRATEAGYGRGPWRDTDGRLHHPPGWKADSDRGRDSNDRDDRARYDRY